MGAGASSPTTPCRLKRVFGRFPPRFGGIGAQRQLELTISGRVSWSALTLTDGTSAPTRQCLPPSSGGSCSHRCRFGFHLHSANRRLTSARERSPPTKNPSRSQSASPGQRPSSRLTARVVRIEPEASKRLPAAMGTAFHVATILVLAPETDAAIGTGLLNHRAAPVAMSLTATFSRRGHSSDTCMR